MLVKLILKETHTQTEMAVTGQQQDGAGGCDEFGSLGEGIGLWLADLSGEDTFQFSRVKSQL